MRTKTKNQPIEQKIISTVKALAFPTFIIWVGLILLTNAFVNFASGGTGEIFYDNFAFLYFIASVYIANRLRKVLHF